MVIRPRTILFFSCCVLAAVSVCLFPPFVTRSEDARLARITTTPSQILSINPTLSGDGSTIAFESTADVPGAQSPGFRLLRAATNTGDASIRHIASSRAPAPALSQDGRIIAFAADADLIGTNTDRNSEIFLHDGTSLRQVTFTAPPSPTSRATFGNFNPSISDDGRFIAFSSTADITGRNPDLTAEIILFDSTANTFTQITNSNLASDATDAKISGDGSRIAFIRRAASHGVETASSGSLMLYEQASGRTVMLAADLTRLAMTYGRAINDDGTRIVFSAESAPGASQVFLFDLRLNDTRQLTNFTARADDVPLHPTISGDGSRIAFATRRSVAGFANVDRGVELYAYDLPLREFMRITDSPASVGVEVVSSINDDGTLVAFNFPRSLTSPTTNADFGGNSEIYLATLAPRPPPTADLVILNAASLDHAPAPTNTIAPGSIAILRGTNLALFPARATSSQTLPIELAGTTVTLDGIPVSLFSVSPTEISFLVPPRGTPGSARIVVTNIDGLQRTGTAEVRHAAPGVFTVSGDGSGDAVALDAKTRRAAPFDSAATEDATHILVFSTGVREAGVLMATLDDVTVPIERVIPSPDVAGLDQVEIALPSSLLNRGRIALRLHADGRASNSTRLLIAGVTFNEILVDPPDDLAGDANPDGVRSAADDEFIELVNSSSSDLSIGGYELLAGEMADTATLRHKFADDTIIPAHTSIVVFGGATEATFNPAHLDFGGAQVVLASSGGLGLRNGGGFIALRSPDVRSIDEFVYGSSGIISGNRSQSITRAPDILGTFVLHTEPATSGNRLYSPGTRTDGTPFIATPAATRITVEPTSATLQVGETRQFRARAFNASGAELRGVIFNWQTNSNAIARVDRSGTVTALAPGVATITASARGVRSSPGTITVEKPLPSVVRVEVTPQSSAINRGGVATFAARAFDRNGIEISGAAFSFASLNPLVATIGGVTQGGTISVRGSGIGAATIRVTTSDGAGGTINAEATIDVRVPLVINEILADVQPDDSATPNIEGDANRDGVRSFDDDEFVEVVNNSTAPLDISGIRISDSTSNRFTFPANTTLAAGSSAIIFGGGAPPSGDSAFGGATVFSASSLGLNDAGDTVSLKLPLGSDEVILAAQSYGTNGVAPAPSDESLTRAPDATQTNSGNSFIAHSAVPAAATRRFSPGTRADGTPFNSLPLSRIEITPAAVEFETNETTRFTARAFTTVNGIEVEVPNVSFVWEASAPGRISLRPLTGAETNATGIARGEVELRARASGASGIARLTIKPVVASIELTPTSISITENQETIFRAKARDAAGAEIPNLSFTFSLRNAAPADAASIISSTAETTIVRGTKAGTATLVASFRRPRDGVVIEATASLHIVEAPRLTRIEVQPLFASIIVGARQQFTARALDQRGAEITDVRFDWLSSSVSIATINADGLATGASVGSTLVTATASGVTSAPATLSVIAPPPRIVRIEVTPSISTINRGSTQLFSARAFEENNREATDARFSYSSTDPAITTIEANGTARGVGVGMVTIRVSTSDNRGSTVTGEATLTVRVPLVINEIFADLPVDDPATLEIEGDANRDGVRDSDDDEFIELVNASAQPVDISNVRIADSTTTRFTFPQNTILAAGRAAIVFGGGAPPSAMSTFGGALVFTANSLSLNDGGDTINIRLPVGSTEQLIVTQSYGTGEPAPAAPRDQSLTRSPDAGKESFGGNFVAHTVAPNSASRIFSPGTRADGTPFDSPALTRIEVAPASQSIAVGDSQQFAARAFARSTDGTEIEIQNVSLIWEATNGAQLAPRAGTSTTVRAVLSGVTTVRAAAGGVTGEATLTATPVVASIELAPQTASITVGGSATFTATARDANGGAIDGAGFEFSIRDLTPTNAATITNQTANTVTVRGDAAGSATVVARHTRTSDNRAFEVVSALTINLPAEPPRAPAAGEVVINEALISFATSSTQARADFIELYNTTNRPLDISSLVISFRPGGNSNLVRSVTLPGAIGSNQTLIEAGGYFVVADGAATFGETTVYDASAVGFDLNNTTGAIQLEIGTIKLDGLTYQGGSVPPAAEFLSFGEGGIFTFTSGTTNDLIRQPNASDTNNNAADFRRNGTTANVSPRATNPPVP